VSARASAYTVGYALCRGRCPHRPAVSILLHFRFCGADLQHGAMWASPPTMMGCTRRGDYQSPVVSALAAVSKGRGRLIIAPTWISVPIINSLVHPKSSDGAHKRILLRIVPHGQHKVYHSILRNRQLFQ